jgi:hypothetical protein
MINVSNKSFRENHNTHLMIVFHQATSTHDKMKYDHNHRTTYNNITTTSNTPTPSIDKTISIARSYHDRSNFTYIIGDYNDKLSTEVISVICCENAGMTTF